MTLRRRLAAVLVAASVALALAGCTNDPLADQYRSGSNQGFIGADGLTVGSIAPDQRGAPIAFSGSTGSETISSSDLAGDVVAVNFWYAGCGPCRAEAPALEKASEAFAGQDVRFVGVNIYDESPDTVAAFATTYKITYPSLLAVDDADLKLAFADAVPLSAVPVTLVLDRQGRVAARIVGALQDDSILTTLIRETLAESP